MSVFSKWISNVPYVSANKEDLSFRIVKLNVQKYMLGFVVILLVMFRV